MVVGVLAAGAGWFSHWDAERVPFSAFTPLPMARGRAACPPPMLTPHTGRLRAGSAVGGCMCARYPQKGRSDRALLTSSSGSSEPRSGCPQGHGLSASTLSFSSPHLTVERKGHLCSPSFQEHTAAPGSWQLGPRCGGAVRPGGRPHCPLKPRSQSLLGPHPNLGAGTVELPPAGASQGVSGDRGPHRGCPS